MTLRRKVEISSLLLISLTMLVSRYGFRTLRSHVSRSGTFEYYVDIKLEGGIKHLKLCLDMILFFKPILVIVTE